MTDFFDHFALKLTIFALKLQFTLIIYDHQMKMKPRRDGVELEKEKSQFVPTSNQA